MKKVFLFGILLVFVVILSGCVGETKCHDHCGDLSFIK
jgi:hypothetical protein